jgi:hypothetical protein
VFAHQLDQGGLACSDVAGQHDVFLQAPLPLTEYSTAVARLGRRGLQ